MRPSLTISLALLVFLCACNKTPPVASAPPAPSAAPPAKTTPEPAASAATAAPADAIPVAENSLTSFAAGAWLIKKPAEYDESWSAFRLLDERSNSGWATPKGTTGPQQFVIVLPEKTLLKSLAFDTASVDGDAEGSRAAKDILVEVSDISADSGFETIANVSLAARADKQRFPVSKEVGGHWIRLTAKNNHGSTEYIELMDFRGYGEQLSKTPQPDLSGTYQTNYGDFHLQQQGGKVSGCYEHKSGLIENGGVENRVVRFTWTEQAGNTRERGPAVFGFSPDGKELLGLWWYDSDTTTSGKSWIGKKTSDKVGVCPHWKGADEGGRLAASLSEGGHVKLYGITFDTDSDRIKDESRPTLDEVVKVAKDKPDWRFTVEGHTDSTASDTHNQQLSEKRANAVKVYLAAAGIAGERVNAIGLGASKPVADNGTALGRSQNRRVELVKQEGK